MSGMTDLGGDFVMLSVGATFTMGFGGLLRYVIGGLLRYAIG